MATPDTLFTVLGFESRPTWKMCPAERLAIIGLIEVLRPLVTLELGHGHGTCTEWLAKYSHSVYSVDQSPWVIESCKRWGNVHPLHMTTSDALNSFISKGSRFDLAIVDAGHSYKAGRSDLEGTLKIADVILLHDTFNPQCRAGYTDALEGSGAFADLDFLSGGQQSDGGWGGLGVVLPKIPDHSIRSISPRMPYVAVPN